MKIFYYIISGIFLIVIVFLLYNKLFFTDIIVKFDELEPFNDRMNVYYKGYKIGKTGNIFPKKDYSETYLKLKISRKNLNFPKNIKAELKNNGGKPYISISYPNSPELKKIKGGDIIEGKYKKNIDSFIDDTINGENLQDIVGNASNLMENANKTVISLGNVFDEITVILQDIRPNIKNAAKNIELTTTNLKNISNNLNNALNKSSTKNSVENIEETTENLKNITTQLNEVSIPTVNSILCETNETVKNTKEIAKGLNCTLKKHFGAMRLFFGKAVSKCKNCE